MSDHETGPVPLDGRAPKQRLFRFDSTVSMGTLLQMGLITTACILGYGTYAADQARQKMEVEQIKVDASGQRTAMKESLGELRTDVKEVQKSLIDINQSMAVLKARTEPQPQNTSNLRRQP